MKHGDIVFVFGYEGEVVDIKDSMVLVHFGGDSLHCIQEWYNIEDVVCDEQQEQP